MLGGVAQQDRGAPRTLEPQMRVVIPGEANAAVDLHGLHRCAHIGVGGHGLGVRGEL